ncbi:hypothetical protein FEM33_20470 [Dyadobacter flavalbus]|uniref:Uncharacterized protein n=1 Tax=Dyadobacter flavalbus TaxID=2579942 RepID=A0A5M8QQ97_9BACT|nr:hypothetical protein [Dyadobacter flavalbus]KAA6436826.1 hypothetical protein FEM33_20470 [Dyadobacter flavalbus]
MNKDIVIGLLLTTIVVELIIIIKKDKKLIELKEDRLTENPTPVFLVGFNLSVPLPVRQFQ